MNDKEMWIDIQMFFKSVNIRPDPTPSVTGTDFIVQLEVHDIPDDSKCWCMVSQGEQQKGIIITNFDVWNDPDSWSVRPCRFCGTGKCFRNDFGRRR